MNIIKHSLLLCIFYTIIACSQSSKNSSKTTDTTHTITHSFLIAGPSFTGVLDESGDVIWEAKRPATRDAYVLTNGNYLICWSDEVVEYDSQNNVLFNYTKSELNAELSTAERLDNGNTLIAELGNQPHLLEINPQGKIVVTVPLDPEKDNAHMQT